MYSSAHTNIVCHFRHLPTEIVIFINVCYQVKCFSGDSFSFLVAAFANIPPTFLISCEVQTRYSRTLKYSEQYIQDHLLGTKVILESYHLFTFNFAKMFHSTIFTFRPLKNITKHLFIMWHMVIPFSFIFKSPALHKYVSASSLSESSKLLVLQFLVKCCKLNSVFKILSKSHMLNIFLISSVYYKCSYKL